MSNEEFNYEDMMEGDDNASNVDNVGVVQNQDVQDVAPVKLGKGKVLAILIFFLVILIFVLIILDGVDIKKGTGTVNYQTEVQSSVSQSSSATSTNSGDAGNEISESSAVSSEVSSTSTENINSSVSSTNDVSQGVGSKDELGLVQGEVVEPKEEDGVEKAEFELLSVEPMLGAEITVSGMVKGKSMYRVGDSYTYGVNLILITGNDTNVECTYFCPKKTSDALKIGDSLNVIYQCDSNGNVCVVSISK